MPFVKKFFRVLCDPLGVDRSLSHMYSVSDCRLKSMVYSDVGCYGGEITTPNIDKLADGELRFAQAPNLDRLTGPHEPRKFAGRFLGHGTPLEDREGKWWCTAFCNGNAPVDRADAAFSKEIIAAAQDRGGFGLLFT